MESTYNIAIIDVHKRVLAVLHNQLENLLEELQIKLSSMLSDLLGKSGRRIPRALADGETDPVRLADLGHQRPHASKEELLDALTGHLGPLHRQLLCLHLERLDLIEEQMATLETTIAETLQSHQEAVARLVEIPGIGVDSAQQILAEIGPAAVVFLPRPHWHLGWEYALEDKRAPVNLAATAPPKAIGPCGD